MILLLLIEYARVDNTEKWKQEKTKNKTKQNRPHWQKKAPQQNNGTDCAGSEATNLTTWWRIMVYLLKIIFSKDKQTNTQTHTHKRLARLHN